MAIRLEIPRDLVNQSRSFLRPNVSFMERCVWSINVESNPSNVRIQTPEDFLQANPQFISLVKEASVRLLQAFGPSTQVHQKLLLDHQDPDPEPELFLVASVSMAPAEAIEKMERLEEDWWFDQFERSEGRVHLTFKHRAQ